MLGKKGADMPKKAGQQVQEQRRKINIKWVVEDDLRRGFGHGLEFWYSRGNSGNRIAPDEDTDILVASVKDFGWFHNPLQKWVTVKILPADSPLLKRSKIPADEIISAIRFGVKKFFETTPPGAKMAQENKVTDVVRVWFNA
jgi:hypothetical protein